jgi:hypothetical protein
MTEAIVIEEVGPFLNEDDPDGIYYRTCDFCCYSALDAIWQGKLSESEWRRFYWILPDGLSACDQCVQDLPEYVS